MRAAVLIKPGKVAVIEVADPVPGDDQVLVRMEAVGICGSDLNVFEGAKPTPDVPWILGHEGTGRIMAAGRHAVARIGEHVVVEPNYCCLNCSFCARGATSACPGRVVLGMNRPGVLADFVPVPTEFAVTVPGSVELADRVCAEPLAVGHAAIRRSGLRAGDSCAVVGFGSAGSLLSILLRRLGYRPCVVETDPGRRSRAAEIGAVIAGTDEEFDVVFDASSRPGQGSDSLRLVRPGGTLVLVGISNDVMPWTSAAIVYRQVTIKGSLIYDHPADFRDTVALLASGSVQPRYVLGPRFPLDRAMEAFAQARRSPGKTWITFG